MYFKVTNKDVLSAWKESHDKCNSLKKSCESLCNFFGGKPVYTGGFTEFLHFAGISGVTENNHLWTASNRNGASRPKKRTEKQFAETLKDINSNWSDKYPKPDFVSTDLIYDSLAIHWSNVAFDGGIRIFEHNGALYISMKIRPKLTDGITEILGSEFMAADNATEMENVK